MKRQYWVVDNTWLYFDLILLMGLVIGEIFVVRCKHFMQSSTFSTPYYHVYESYSCSDLQVN